MDEASTDPFEAFFLEHHCLRELAKIYTSCWPNEQVGPKILHKNNVHEDITSNFARESFKNMKKFARFFGLSSILLVSNQEALAKVWQDSFHDSEEHVKV